MGEAAQIDVWALAVNGPLAAVVMYLYREVQRLHNERHQYMNNQVEMLQKIALRLGEKADV